MNRTLILFAKAPRFGMVKTRLAKDIGAIKALRFYKNTLTTIARKLQDARGFDLIIATTPDTALDDGGFSALNAFPLIPQGKGDLGARMRRFFMTVPKGPTIIIGSDIPEITPAHIEKAFAALGESDAVFGRCSDGGYWLVGLKNMKPMPPDFMKNVRWSTNATLNDTLRTLPKRFKVSYIDTLEDIDDGADYATWKAQV